MLHSTRSRTWAVITGLSSQSSNIRAINHCSRRPPSRSTSILFCETSCCLVEIKQWRVGKGVMGSEGHGLELCGGRKWPWDVIIVELCSAKEKNIPGVRHTARVATSFSVSGRPQMIRQNQHLENNFNNQLYHSKYLPKLSG